MYLYFVGVLGQVWYLIVSISNRCFLLYFQKVFCSCYLRVMIINIEMGDVKLSKLNFDKKKSRVYIFVCVQFHTCK